MTANKDNVMLIKINSQTKKKKKLKNSQMELPKTEKSIRGMKNCLD